MNDVGVQPSAAAVEPVVVDKGITTGLPNVGFFIENETGIMVKIEGFFVWEPYEKVCSIEYPASFEGAHPRRYAMPEREVAKYFSWVTPQEVFLSAFGATHDRPTPKQLELETQAQVAENPG